MKALEKYWVVIKLGLTQSMEYRFNFFSGLLSYVFPVIMQFFLWSAVYQNNGAQQVHGYNFAQMISYTVLAGLVSTLVSADFAGDVANDIKNGGLSKFLIQPIRYQYYRISAFIGQKASQLILLALMSVALLIGLHLLLGMTVHLSDILLFLPAIALAMGMNFLIFYCISAASFWILEVGALFHIFALLSNIASGGVFPLDIFGEQAMQIFKFLPFQYIIYFPLNIITGKLEMDVILTGMGIQLLWIVMLAALSSILWRRGLKKFVAVGG